MRCHKGVLVCAVLSLFGCAMEGADELDDTAQAVVGVANMRAFLYGSNTALVNGTHNVDLVVQNFSSGATAAAANTTCVVDLPAGVIASTIPSGCAAGPGPQQVTCSYGTVGAGASRTKTFGLTFPATDGTVNLVATVSTTSPETPLTDNTARLAVNVNLPAPVPLVYNFPQNIAVQNCVGSAITSFQQCVPSSILRGTFVLNANNTAWTGSTTVGTWSQPGGPTTLSMEIRNSTTGAFVARYDLVSVSSTCAEGTGVNYQGGKLGARWCAVP